MAMLLLWLDDVATGHLLRTLWEAILMCAAGPLIIPDVVIDCLRRWLKEDPMAYLHRPAPAWNGLSPIEWVRSGHRWDEVLTKLTRFFEGEISA